MNTYFHEIELIGGPLDGLRTHNPWIPLSGMQIATTAGNGKVAQYEWVGTKTEMIDHIPQVRHQLKFCGYYRSAIQVGCDAVRNLVCWCRNLAHRNSPPNADSVRDCVAQG